MIKILRTVPFFAPAYGYGGPVIHTLNVSKIQASMGLDVRIFTTNILTNDIISKDLPKYEIIDGIKVHRFPIKYRLWKSHYFITPQLPYNFLKYDYDLIHSHSFQTFQTDISTIISILNRKPFVFTAHGTLRNITLFNWFKNKKKESRIIRFHDLIFKKIFITNVDRVIVHSKYEKYWTVKNNIPEDKIHVIPHGVNIKNFDNLAYKSMFLKKYEIKDKMILYVGRLLRNYRNLEHLILGMQNIIEEVKNVKLWFIGHSFDKDYEFELKKLVKKLNLEDYVKFILKPTRSDIIGAYQTANVVLFPITDSDSFGIPFLEAGAAKCPIISINRGPAPELVKNGKNGFLIDLDNEHQLIDKILKILNNKELEKKMGNKGYDMVVKYYTWDTVAKQTVDLYKELL